MRLSRSAFVRSGLAATTLGVLPTTPLGAQTPAAQTSVTLRGIYFPSADILPCWVGIEKGFFGRENVTLLLTATPGSVYQFQHLSAGDFDIALTAIDNAIAYDEGQGQAPLPNPADFAAFLGIDNGFLRLYAQPEIKSYADLRGKALAVDALTTGFAFVLRRMLETNGLHDGDYTFTPIGGTPIRFEKLMAGETPATLLIPPFDLQARAKGYTSLGTADDVIGPYQGLVAVASRAWLAANGDAARRFVRGYLAALNWVLDPANRVEAIAILIAHMKLDDTLAAACYDVLVDAKHGFERGGRIDVAGVRTVLAIRQRYGQPPKTFGDPQRYLVSV
ncbi:MAG: ABC transporter substrate-binding protein [Vulcanimicrobiaceae bacterium]|jgi:ABC-type nitrate/sulfonate/bicarbonate transport system substrate-binding protein